MSGRSIEMSVSSTVFEGAGCQEDSLPFLAQIPLNIVGLEPGEYSVEVNGVSADFSLPFENVTAP